MKDRLRGVRTLVRGHSSTHRLVALPHSGGRAENFGCWAEMVPAVPGAEKLELCAIQYPGHGDRIAEEPVADVVDLARQIVSELLQLRTMPLVLFGHSFGSMVAFEVAHACELAGLKLELLVVSSSWAVNDPARPASLDHLLPSPELWQRIVALGGIDPRVANDLELRDLLLPVLRNDMAAQERYLTRRVIQPLSCDLQVYLADQDPLVPVRASAGWARQTKGRVTTCIRSGGHFHIFDNPAPLLQALVDRLAVSPATKMRLT